MKTVAVDGVDYRVLIDGEGPPLVLLHGFTGSGESWDAFRFETEFRAVRVDLIGHGRTTCPSEPDRYRMDAVVDDLFRLLDLLGIDDVFLLGYSMGGRIALHAALRQPDRIRALILESASYGIEDERERTERRERDARLAERIERFGVASFVEAWENAPLFASQKRLAPHILERQRSQRLRNDPHGLANALRGLGPGSHECLLPQLPSVTTPTLIVVGALDERYVAIGRRMRQALPNARLHVVDDAGHNVHLERSDRFASAVFDFLKSFK